jgi:predicted glycosyltransferase
VLVSVKDKDIILDLVKDLDFVQISTGYRKKNILSILTSLIERDKKLCKIAKEFKPDLMIGTSPEIAHISKFIKVPALFFGEDDVNLSLIMYLGAIASYPFFDRILAPICVNNGIWNTKTTFYNGFQKLAYLHPNRFTPQRNLVELEKNTRFFIIRFSGLTAYHDSGLSGISDQLAKKIISVLSKEGKVIISSERPLSVDLESMRFKGNLKDMHHYLAYADLFIGDSQTMCSESGLLGTPFIRYNDFVGKISYMNEIENKHHLGFGIKAGNEEELLNKIAELSKILSLKEIYLKRKEALIKEKIDVTAFYVWFIENYPDSILIMKNNPDYQYSFK